MKNFLIVFFVLIQISVITNAQYATIQGVVQDNGKAISAASVVLTEHNVSKTTNEKGEFKFSGLAPGKYTLQVSMLGFEPLLHPVTLKTQETVSITIPLKETILNYSEVVINASTTRQGESKLDAMAMQLQPLKSAQDLLRSIPGLFIAQHAGGGKAEQIFVRGNDNDHGTDFAVFWDGIPVNLPSHAHGQGYADMHFIIPEVVGRTSFFKGPYDARLGDFSISGAALFNSKPLLDKNTAKVEYGMYNSQRYLLMMNLLDNNHLVKKWNDQAYVAAEYTFNNGFFINKLNLKRYNIFGRYNATISPKTDLIFTISTFSSNWDASGQLPRRAIEAGVINRLGSVDNSEGGITSRTNISLKSTTLLSEKAMLSNQLYYSRNNFTLFSNFTFFMNDTVNGDEIKQWEHRNLLGYKTSYTRQDSLGKTELRSEAGISIRKDIIDRGRDHVLRRALLEVQAANQPDITNYSLYVDENWKFLPRWNLNIGIRNEWFNFRLKDFVSDTASGQKVIYRFNPKLNIYFDLTKHITLFAKSGIGFHSNFVQAVLDKSVSSDPVPQSYGGDLGSNFKVGNNIIASFAAWWLHVGSEYKFIADDGTFENIGDARKIGMDLSVKMQLVSNLWCDINLNYAKGILLQAPKNENLLPLHPRWNSTGGVTYKSVKGINGSIRYRYMGKRPATADGVIQANSYFILDALVRFTKPKYEVGISVENILNKQWDEAQFYDASRLRNEAFPVQDFHITPGTPLFLKAIISYFF